MSEIYRCTSCGTTCQGRQGEDGFELLNPISGEWETECPNCFCSAFDFDHEDDEDEN